MPWWEITILLVSIAVGVLVGTIVSDFIGLNLRPPAKNPDGSKTSVQPPHFSHELLDEIETNYRIANNHSAARLLPFQISIWESGKYAFGRLGTGLQRDLAQAYIDMRLANNIVWLATDLGRKNASIEEHYVALCLKIAARLAKICIVSAR